MTLLPGIHKENYLLLLSTLVLFLGVFVGVSLVQQQQELRERAASIPAFPGAEGFGAKSVGGRGGKVFEVTNLNNSGSGSLRACVEASGPRTCVFRTGGTIGINSDLAITNPYITIAGQTAPGGGITLKGSTLSINTHDVIVRYLRVRSGPIGNKDGVSIHPSGKDIIFDHCSVSWATDENFSPTGDTTDVTVQWCIIAEGLYDSNHPKGPHSMGMLITASGNISVHHTLLAHHRGRHPKVTRGNIDLVNNVIYNWGYSATEASDRDGSLRLNYVGNYIKPGLDSRTSVSGLSLSGSSISAYVKGNIGEHSRPSNDLPEWDIVNGSESRRTLSRHNFPQVTTTSAFDAFDQVLANAGATLPMRDSVDSRIVNSVRKGTGRFIDDPSQVGGWPQLAAGTPPVDSDHDGMADNWEISQFGSLSRDGRGDANNNGYTDLEEYLNQLAGAVPPPPGTPTPPPTTPTPKPTKSPTPSPTKPPTPTSPPSGFTLLSEAEEMTLVSPMTLGTGDANALGTKYISPTSGSNSTLPTAEATLNFTLPSTGVYYLWARIMGPDGGSDALYVGVDGSFDRVFPSGVGFYDWVKVETSNGSGSYAFSLSGGGHTYQVGHGEIKARLDAVYITDDPNDIPTFSPGALPPPTLPGDIDGDNDVDIFDYNILIENFGNTNCGNVADINSDCKVDIFDYNILVENFGK